MANIREGTVQSFSVDPGKTQVVRSNWATRMEVVSAGGTKIVTIVPANAEVTISSSAEGYSDVTINMHVEQELAPLLGSPQRTKIADQPVVMLGAMPARECDFVAERR